jgi:hypothetical protein
MALKTYKLERKEVGQLPTFSSQYDDFVVTESIERLAKQKVRLNPDTPEPNGDENKSIPILPYKNFVYDMGGFVPTEHRIKMGKLFLE